MLVLGTRGYGHHLGLQNGHHVPRESTAKGERGKGGASEDMWYDILWPNPWKMNPWPIRSLCSNAHKKGVRGESQSKLFSHLRVRVLPREIFFILENWINVCCQRPNQTTVYCSKEYYFPLFYCQALHIVLSKTGQGGYRQQCIGCLILTILKLCLTTAFYQSILKDKESS